jgi:hypothetical protein
MDKNKFKPVKNNAEKNYNINNKMEEEFASELNEESFKKNLSSKNNNQNKNYKEDKQK